MLERVMRASGAASINPSVHAGSNSALQPRGITGSHRSHTENTRMTTNPKKNAGIEMPNRLTVVAVTSIQVSFL